MKPKSEAIIKLEQSLRKDLRAMLREELADVSDKKLDKIEKRIINRACMHMCQRSDEPMA